MFINFVGQIYQKHLKDLKIKQPLSLLAGGIIIGFVIGTLNYRKKRTCQKMLLVGGAGTGKTLTFNQISNNNIRGRKKQDFDEFQINDFISIVDTPSIEFEDNIDLREELIAKYQKYFNENRFQISQFILFVKFERLDIMSKKVMAVYKFLNKFKSRMNIMITDFQLSESPEKDKNDVLQRFKIYGCPLYYSSTNDTSEQLISTFLNIAYTQCKEIQ